MANLAGGVGLSMYFYSDPKYDPKYLISPKCDFSHISADSPLFNSLRSDKINIAVWKHGSGQSGVHGKQPLPRLDRPVEWNCKVCPYYCLLVTSMPKGGQVCVRPARDQGQPEGARGGAVIHTHELRRSPWQGVANNLFPVSHGMIFGVRVKIRSIRQVVLVYRYIFLL